MAVSSVSSFSLPASQSANQQNPRQTFMQLVSAISAGDLTGARQAYASLVQQQGNTPSNPNDPVSQALKQIGQELQANDISGAQQTLASLQQQAQGSHHAHHHRHHGGGSPPPDPAILGTTDSSDPNSPTINIVV